MKKGNSRRRTLLATGLASLALLATISTATYAWFSINTVVNVNVSSLTAVTGDNIQISDDGSTWGSDVNLILDELDSTVTDISGDGENFYTKSGNATSDYVEFDLQFRANSYYHIYLNDSSDVVPHLETGKVLQGAGTIQDKSAYGNFSKNYIAAAVRIAFIKPATQNSAEQVQLVWAPNKNIKVSGSGTSYSVSESNTAAVAYTYSTLEGEGRGSFDATTAGFLETSQSDQGQSDGNIHLGKNPVATINPIAHGVSSTASVKVRVWIDGEDPECINPFLGGVFDIKLGFSAEAITQAQRPNVTMVANKVNNLITNYSINIGSEVAANLEVSTDGEHYAAYNSETTYANQRVWVRKTAASTSNGVPSAAMVLEAGKLDQAKPVITISTDPVARSFTLTSGFAQGMQYSVDGANWISLGAATVTGLDNNPRTIRVRYAATDTHNASDFESEAILGKRAKPTTVNVGAINGLTGEITYTGTFKHTAPTSTAFSAVPVEGDMIAGGGTDMLNEGDYIAFVYPGDGVQYVSSAILYVQYTGGQLVEIAGPNA